jgi:hypothetical protein
MRLAMAPDASGPSICAALRKNVGSQQSSSSTVTNRGCRCTVRSANLIDLSEASMIRSWGRRLKMEAAAVLQQSRLRARIHYSDLDPDRDGLPGASGGVFWICRNPAATLSS